MINKFKSFWTLFAVLNVCIVAPASVAIVNMKSVGHNIVKTVTLQKNKHIKKVGYETINSNTEISRSIKYISDFNQYCIDSETLLKGYYSDVPGWEKTLQKNMIKVSKIDIQESIDTLKAEKTILTEISTIIKNHPYDYSIYLNMKNLYIPSMSSIRNVIVFKNSVKPSNNITNSAYKMNRIINFNNISFNVEEAGLAGYSTTDSAGSLWKATFVKQKFNDKYLVSFNSSNRSYVYHSKNKGSNNLTINKNYFLNKNNNENNTKNITTNKFNIFNHSYLSKDLNKNSTFVSESYKKSLINNLFNKIKYKQGFSGVNGLFYFFAFSVMIFGIPGTITSVRGTSFISHVLYLRKISKKKRIYSRLDSSLNKNKVEILAQKQEEESISRDPLFISIMSFNDDSTRSISPAAKSSPLDETIISGNYIKCEHEYHQGLCGCFKSAFRKLKRRNQTLGFNEEWLTKGDDDRPTEKWWTKGPTANTSTWTPTSTPTSNPTSASSTPIVTRKMDADTSVSQTFLNDLFSPKATVDVTEETDFTVAQTVEKEKPRRFQIFKRFKNLFKKSTTDELL